MLVDVFSFYHCWPLYLYMPSRMFDALEAAFLDGATVARVNEADFLYLKRNTPAEVWPG